jgi:signal transduction histidine kinase/CheY-like chemotaxis protein
MRNLPGVLVLLLLALLGWLLLRGIDTNQSEYAVTLRAFDDYALSEASLHRDVLQARSGLLRNYDSFVDAINAMDRAVTQLRSRARAQQLDARPIDQLAAAVSQQEKLLERFKTSNALLQNSLSYVGLLSTSPAFLAQDVQLAPATGALAAAILHLSRDTSTEALKALQERIDQFAEQAPAVGPQGEVARAMLAHARLLYNQLPAVDETLKTFIAIPSAQALDQARTLFFNHRLMIEAGEQRMRLVSYAVSLLLLVALVLLGLRLRSRVLASRRRAALEHVIAETSTQLISCSPSETAPRLKQVLESFGRTIGAERAYVVLDEKPVRMYTWSVGDKPFPPNWPDQTLTFYEQLKVAEPESVAIPDVAALQAGPVKKALTDAGVGAWACVPLTRPGRVQSIMGFDIIRPRRTRIFSMAVVRLAGDAVANAIEREFLERERTKLTTRLERARRMQMVGSLASGIAHNFNNIIGAILGYSEMIEPQLARGTKPAQHVEEIRRAAERARELVDNILVFGRRADGRARPVQMCGLLEESASLLRASLPSGVDLVFEDVSTDVAVLGEPAQLQQIVLNLCTNAAQAMEQGGCIRVDAKSEQVAGFRRMSDGELSPGRYVCLAVSDTGRGFDERVTRRLFEPFFTTRQAGTGLGLATVREIVRDHDGAIGVQSQPGRGSRIEVWLPAIAVGNMAIDKVTVGPLGRGETVLLVESERDRLVRDEEKLAALGYEPVGFELPADALAACRAEPGRFDIIIVSHAAAGEDGLNLARALHRIAPLPPVLLAAPSTVDISVNMLAEAGVSEVVAWPLASEELAAALDRWVRASDTLQS